MPGARDATIVQHAAVPGRLPSQCVVQLERMFYPMRRRHANQHPHRRPLVGKRRCGVPVPGDDAGLQHARLPGRLRRVRVECLERVLGHVRGRHSNQHALDQPASPKRRRLQLRIAADHGVQLATVPHRLRGQCVESHVVPLFCLVRRRHLVQHALGHGSASQRRQGLPRADADAGVQHAGVRGGLPSVRVESHLVSLLCHVWRRHVDQHALGDGSASEWRCGLPRADADTGLQHARLPGRLRRFGLGPVVSLLCLVRWGFSIPIPHGGDRRSERRQGLPRVGTKTRLQHDPLCRQLRRQRVVRMVGLLHPLRRRVANPKPHGGDGGGQWWHRMPGFEPKPGVQHSGVSD